jgi:hypothetical protein
MVITEKNNLGDWLKYESPNLYSREDAIVASGQNLKLGTVVGKVKETDLIKQLDPDAEDGTEVAIGVLLENVDASAANTKAVFVVREAIIAHNAVVWPFAITDEQKKAAIESLKNYGIVIRKGA